MILSEKRPEIDDITLITQKLEETLEDADMGAVTQLSIAIDEIYSNIVYYSGADEAKVTLEVKNGAANLVFIDNGKEYNPLEKEDPDVTADVEERGIGGLGIFLVKQFADDMRYEREENKNVLTIVKKI